MEIDTSSLSASERYKLLVGLVFPRPIALVSTRSENGVANGMHVSSKEYDEDVSEFPEAGFTEAPYRMVEHPRIADERYRPVGRLYASRYCTTRQRFELPGPLPSE
jgi:hypothetical protein